MKVVILAGGYGTRLSEKTDVIPKPMIEIGGKPLLWHIMKIFSSQGLNDFVIALGYKGHVIKRYFLEYSRIESDLKINLSENRVETVGATAEPWCVELIDTGKDVMTGGRLKRLKDKIDSTIIFTYGDGLADIDIRALLAFHRSHGRLATVTAISPPSRFGTLRLDKNRVIDFREKPNTTEEWVSGGFFVLEPEALDYIEGDDTAWETDPCLKLASDGELMAYKHTGYWQCIDTLHELRLTQNKWDNNIAPWKTW